jgi:hypothetical protein
MPERSIYQVFYDHDFGDYFITRYGEFFDCGFESEEAAEQWVKSLEANERT